MAARLLTWQSETEWMSHSVFLFRSLLHRTWLVHSLPERERSFLYHYSPCVPRRPYTQEVLIGICQWPCKPLCYRRQCKYWLNTRPMSMRETRIGRPPSTWRQPIRLSSVQKWSSHSWAVSTSPTEEGAQPCTMQLWMDTWRWVFASVGTGTCYSDPVSHRWSHCDCWDFMWMSV